MLVELAPDGARPAIVEQREVLIVALPVLSQVVVASAKEDSSVC
jgi:hypothetical protein